MVTPVPPNWLIEPSNLKVVEGSSASIDCSVQGYPSPQVTWKRVTQSSKSPPIIGILFRTIITFHLFRIPDPRCQLSPDRHPADSFNWSEAVLISKSMKMEPSRFPKSLIYDAGRIFMRGFQWNRSGNLESRLLDCKSWVLSHFKESGISISMIIVQSALYLVSSSPRSPDPISPVLSKQISGERTKLIMIRMAFSLFPALSFH